MENEENNFNDNSLLKEENEEVNKMDIKEVNIEKDSDNSNRNVKANRKKIFLSSLIDFVVQTLILTVLFGAVTMQIINGTGLINGFKNVKNEYYSMLKETRLSEFDENNEPIDTNYSAINYIGTLIKTTYFYENEDFKVLTNNKEEVVSLTIKDTISYKENGSYKNDNISYYYLEYRESDKSDLPIDIKNDYKGFDNKYSYLYNGVLKLNDEKFKSYINPELFEDEKGKITSEILDKPILNLETAKILHPYFFLKVNSEKADTITRNLATMFAFSLKNAFDELEVSSPKYIALQEDIFNERVNLFKTHLAGLFITYIISFSITYLLIPLAFKGKTPGMKFSRILYGMEDYSKPKIGNFIIKYGSMFFTQMISLGIPIYLIYKSQLEVINFNLFWGINFKYLLISFAIMTGISLLMGLFSKDHRFLGDTLSKIYFRDEDLFELESKDEDKEIIEVSTNKM